MISHTHAFLFLHTPKTAGNSVQNILQAYSENDIVTGRAGQDGLERFEVRDASHPSLHKHSTLRDYEAAYGRGIRTYYTFSTLRNPFDKVVSFYFSPHRGEVVWDAEAFARFITTVDPLEHYIARSRLNRLFFSARHIDRLMRFEHLSEDFAEVCARIGIESAPLAVRNKSKRMPYRDCFSAETRRYVETRHAREIALGGYAF